MTKYLKIDDQKGLYWDGKKYQEIDKIDKQDLLNLLKAAEGDEFEMDKYDQRKIANKAHQIIYKNIYEKFSDFNKDQFKDEVNKLYKDAINKYSVSVEDIEMFDEEETSEEEEGTGDDDGFIELPSVDDIKPEDIPF